MPAIDTEAQFKFLLCCIKHSAAGKINFDNVAQELNIVSKAAAAKRYERLLKAHDITVTTPRKGVGARGNIGSAAEDSGEPKTPASKKRKRAAPAAAANKQDDDEEETPVKKERVAKKNDKKEEFDDDKAKGESASPFHTAPCYRGGGGDGHVNMADIPEAFPRRQGGSGGHRRSSQVDDGDDYCVIVGERPVPVPVPVPVPASDPTTSVIPTPIVSYTNGLDSHGHGYGHGHGGALLPTPPNFGPTTHAVYCHDANLGLPQQTVTTSRSNSTLEARAGTHGAAPPPPFDAATNWGMLHHN